MFRKVWTTEAVCEIIQSAKHKEPLNSHYFSTKHSAVFAAAERLFGSWGNAIEACDISYESIRKYRVWDKAEIQKQIRILSKTHQKLDSASVQRSNKPLYMASIHHFKSWKKAIQSTGLNYDTIRIRRSMSPQEIKKEIKSLYRKGVDLSYPNMRKNHQYLLAAGMKKLGKGSWVKARQVCGIKENFRSANHRKKFMK